MDEPVMQEPAGLCLPCAHSPSPRAPAPHAARAPAPPRARLHGVACAAQRTLARSLQGAASCCCCCRRAHWLWPHKDANFNGRGGKNTYAEESGSAHPAPQVRHQLRVGGRSGGGSAAARADGRGARLARRRRGRVAAGRGPRGLSGGLGGRAARRGGRRSVALAAARRESVRKCRAVSARTGTPLLRCCVSQLRQAAGQHGSGQSRHSWSCTSFASRSRAPRTQRSARTCGTQLSPGLPQGAAAPAPAAPPPASALAARRAAAAARPPRPAAGRPRRARPPARHAPPPAPPAGGAGRVPAAAGAHALSARGADGHFRTAETLRIVTQPTPAAAVQARHGLALGRFAGPRKQRTRGRACSRAAASSARRRRAAAAAAACSCAARASRWHARRRSRRRSAASAASAATASAPARSAKSALERPPLRAASDCLIRVGAADMEACSASLAALT